MSQAFACTPKGVNACITVLAAPWNGHFTFRPYLVLPIFTVGIWKASLPSRDSSKKFRQDLWLLAKEHWSTGTPFCCYCCACVLRAALWHGTMEWQVTRMLPEVNPSPVGEVCSGGWAPPGWQEPLLATHITHCSQREWLNQQDPSDSIFVQWMQTRCITHPGSRRYWGIMPWGQQSPSNSERLCLCLLALLAHPSQQHCVLSSEC